MKSGRLIVEADMRAYWPLVSLIEREREAEGTTLTFSRALDPDGPSMRLNNAPRNEETDS